MGHRYKQQELRAEINRINKLIEHLAKQKERLEVELETYKGGEVYHGQKQERLQAELKTYETGEAYQESKQERLYPKQEAERNSISPQPIINQDFSTPQSIIPNLKTPINKAQSSSTTQLSPDFSLSQKITLLRSLFRGRTDVYARHWTSRKTGKSGYSPVCTNEWKPGTCRKRTIKCSDCPYRDLSPLSDEALLSHLTGSQTIGI